MKKLLYILFLLPVLSFSQTLEVNRSLIIYDNDSVVYHGTIKCENVIQNNRYGFNEVFQESYTISMTKDNWFQLTNATNTLWVQLCGNGFSQIHDTMVCSFSGKFGGIFQMAASGGPGEDYEIRIYDVTAGAEVSYMHAYQSTYGSGNYVNFIMVICFISISGHRYVWEVMNTSNSNDLTTVSGKFWFILMDE